MIYDIRLSGADEDNGKIDLHRLSQIAQSILEIAKGSLQVRLLGMSFEKGRTSHIIGEALKITLTNIKHGSTILELECKPFSETLKGYPGNVFNNEILDELPTQTPVSLVIESFREALDFDENENHLDKPLLRKLKNFQKIFVSQNEFVTISNRGSIPEIVLKKDDFKKIETLEESIPDPQEIILNGIVDEMKYSKSKIIISTSDGPVVGYLSDDVHHEEIKKYWGQNITLSGTAHFMPNGKISFVYIERLFNPLAEDVYFSRNTRKETVEQQIQRQLKHSRFGNQFSEIIGRWPGDESIDEILNDID